MGSYLRYKQNLIETIDEMIEFLKEKNRHTQLQYCHQLKDDISDITFELIVVGEFSRGKSTFINALLKKRILPSFHKPTTTILTYAEYGPHNKVTLYYKDGSHKEITESEFQNIIAGDDQEKIISPIAFGRIQMPSEILKNGVRIVDTPGTNDIDIYREKLTNEKIPQADAAIILLSAKKPLSASEMSLIKDRLLENDLHKIFVVINQMDTLRKEEERIRVKEYVQSHLAEVCDTKRVYMVTALQALNIHEPKVAKPLSLRARRRQKDWELEETNMPELERDLIYFLQNEKGRIKLEKIIKKLQKKLVALLKEELEIELLSLNGDVANIQKELENIEKDINQFVRNSKERKLHILKEHVSSMNELKNWYQDHINSKYEDVLNKVSNHDYGNEDIGEVIERNIANVERNIHSALTAKMKRIHEIHIDEFMSTQDQQKVQVDRKFIFTPEQKLEVDTNVINFTHSKNEIQELADELYNKSLKSKSWLEGLLYGVAATGAGIIDEIVSLFRDPSIERNRKVISKLTSEISKKKRQKMKDFNLRSKKEGNELEQWMESTIQEQTKTYKNKFKNVQVDLKLSAKERRIKQQSLTNEYKHLERFLVDLEDQLEKMSGIEKKGVHV